MRSKLKVLIPLVGVLLVITASFYGEDEDNWVPDMTGVWTGEMVGWGFWDVTDPSSEPFYFEEPIDHDLVITHQAGRTFAGTVEGRKLAGVIMPNRTVSMNYYEPSEERIFITGRVTRSGSTLQISGYSHFFDDFQHRHLPYDEGDKMMASWYFQITKVD
jgi:hypothetical protein